MQTSILAGLAFLIGSGMAAHADCAGSICPPVEQARNSETGTELPLERRIENALKDLEIFNARASTTNPQPGDTLLETRIDSALKDLEVATSRVLRTDKERRKTLLRKIGIER